jgi:Mor family transcriptional regulator
MKNHFNCKFTIEQEKEICYEYINGKSISKVASIYKSSNGTILNILKKNSVPRRKQAEAQTGIYRNNAEKFMKKLIKKENGCLEYPTSKNKNGYATTCYKGKPISAHRFAYILFKKEYNPHLHVLHKCDNPSCCNPDHLFQGTHKDNMNDRDIKGRTYNLTPKIGEKSHLSRFKDVDIIQIRSLYEKGMTQYEIGKYYNAHQSVISNIVLRKTWKHIK